MGNSALQLKLITSGFIDPYDKVMFDEIFFASGSISYDEITGEITFGAEGTYIVQWWIATQSALSYSGVEFAISTSEGQTIQGNSPLKTGEVYGIGIIDVTDTPLTASLISISSGTVYYSQTVPLRGSLVVTENIESITGPTGPQGDIGPTGPQGEIGPTGIQGEVGPTGPQGEIGPTGVQGEIGPTGVQGEVGPTGIQGEVGPTGIQGDIGPTGVQGEVGPTGPQGEIGPTGPQGEIGPTGVQGEVGPTGLQGEIGPTGIQGEVGPTGPQGEIGPTGPTGANVPFDGFSAVLTSLQASSASTIGNWSTSAPYYTTGGFNATAGVYTVPETGTYQISAVINYSLTAAVLVGIGSVNPKIVARRTSPSTTDLFTGLFPILNIQVTFLTLRAVLGNGMVSISGEVELNQGDQIILRYESDGLGLTLNLGGSTAYSYWSIHRIN